MIVLAPSAAVLPKPLRSATFVFSQPSTASLLSMNLLVFREVFFRCWVFGGPPTTQDEVHDVVHGVFSRNTFSAALIRGVLGGRNVQLLHGTTLKNSPTTSKWGPLCYLLNLLMGRVV